MNVVTPTPNPLLTVRPLIVPEHLDDAEAHDIHALVRLGNAVCRYDAGHPFFDQEAAEVLPGWQDQVDNTSVGFVAERGGRVVGIVWARMPNEDGARTLEFEVNVDPELWGQGIEDALVSTIETAARDHGRFVVQSWTLHRRDSVGAILPSPTGFGGVPEDDRQTVFMQAQGYVLQQVERNSTFDLRRDPALVQRTLDDATAAAGADYRLIAWTAPTPPDYAEGFAYALSRMATDVPSGGMVLEEETWDAERIERRDARLLAGGQLVSVACVQHVPSGRIVAFNELMVGGDRAGTTHQWGTLVLREHRGHRLGTIVKCANLLRWRDLAPESPRVSTFNAEENRPMLEINEAIGFVPASYAGAWKKQLS